MCESIGARKNSKNVQGKENSLGQMECREEMADDGSRKNRWKANNEGSHIANHAMGFECLL
jgi:hypothetical protein